MNSSPIRRSPSDIDAAWLTEVLRADGLLESASVTAMASEPVGAGLMGACERYHLTLDRPEPEAPSSVIGKFAAADDSVRAFMGNTGYRNEVCFYEHFAHRLAVRSPRCSHVAIDDDGWFTLILEDLAPARPGDQLLGCSVEQVHDAVTELVGLHAPLWDAPELADHPCFAAATVTDPELLGAGISATIPGFLERYAAALDADAVDFFHRLAGGSAAWFAARPASRTLVHSDYRPDNLLFGTDAGGPPVAVVDWQGLGHGSGLADVAFIVGNALTVDERRANERDLVRAYHDGLCAAGVEGYAWDDCWNDYGLALLSGMLTTVFGAMYGVRTERGDRMFELMAQRHATQALDLGIGDIL
ncbi:MAG: phosphotransferase [Acidimicrobiales bacterium]|nr:phosphotransferase [Acidimicrobiales bacterium]